MHTNPRRGRAKVLLTAALVAAGLGLTGTSTAAAAVPGDDRLQAQPAGWWTYANLTADDVSAKAQANGARVTHLRVENGTDGKLRFTATMVANSGSYGSGWAWYYNQTAAQVNALLAGARPISLQRYWNGAAWRYALVAVTNSGANYRDWTIKEGTAGEIQAQMGA